MAADQAGGCGIVSDHHSYEYGRRCFEEPQRTEAQMGSKIPHSMVSHLEEALVWWKAREADYGVNIATLCGE